MSDFKPFSVERPWGNFRQLTQNEITTIKIHFINPHSSLSLQYHNHRDEFWKIISGAPIVTIGENKIKAKPNDEFMIFKMEKHRIEAGDEAVQILEISYDANFDEEDIIRLEDKYGRA